MSKSAIFNNFSRMIQTSKNQNAKIKLSSFDELYKTVLLLLLEKIDPKFSNPRSHYLGKRMSIFSFDKNFLLNQHMNISPIMGPLNWPLN